MTKGYNTKTCNGCFSYCKEKNIIRPCECSICIWEYEKQSEEIDNALKVVAERIRKRKEVDLEIIGTSKHYSKISLNEEK